MNFYTMPADHFLYREGVSKSDFTVILLEGMISLYKGNDEVQKYEAPALIGEQALLHGGFRDHSIVSIQSEIKFCAVQRDKFKELVRFV